MPFRQKEDVMELEKMRNMGAEELVAAEKSAAEQLFRLRFQKSLGNQEGVKKLRGLKLDIARSKTIARERVLAADKQANPPVAKSAPAPSERTARKQNRTKA